MIVWDLAEYSLVAHEVTQSHPLLLAATSEALGFEHNQVDYPGSIVSGFSE